jgi:hypothetical protein
MADTLKVLGQAALAATTLTDLYVVPVGASATVSSIAVCNRSSTPTAWRMAVAVAGAADATKQYVYYDLPIPGNETFIATVGFTLAAADVIRFYAGAATVTAQVFGVEIT